MSYIVGRIVSLKTNCVILSSVGELIILLLLPIVLFAIVAFQGERIPENNLNLLLIGAFCIFMIPVIGFSLYENCYSDHPILYTIISIIIKVGLLCLIPIVLLVILAFPLKEEEKDRRYRDGTRNNQKTKNFGIIIFLFTCFGRLITCLIKKPNRRIDKKD